jgi:Ca2+-binding RTX toxin-like protein
MARWTTRSLALALTLSVLQFTPAAAQEEEPSGTERARLTWDQATDIDLHVWDEHGNHASYWQPNGIPNATLSPDDTSGYGPEFYVDADDPTTRTFYYCVHYYGAGESGETPTTDAVLVLTDPGGAGRTLEFSLDVNQWHDAGSSPAGATQGCAGPDLPDPLVMQKAADLPSIPVLSANGYTITISNPNDEAMSVSSITDWLPIGFTYTTGTTTGITTDDPDVFDSELTWTGPFEVPAEGDITLYFEVAVSDEPGEYFNEATAESPDVDVTGTGPTAQVVVEACTILGTSGNDVLNGTADEDVICALGGNDTVNGGDGSDIIVGGPGNDRLDGGPAGDILIGDDGSDTLNGDAGDDSLVPGRGGDTLNGGADTDAALYPGGSKVTVDLSTGRASGRGSHTLSGIESVAGSSAGDNLTGDGGANHLSGGAGGDDLAGGGGPDHLTGGAGGDDVSGGPGDDRLFGQAGNDDINGGPGTDGCAQGPGRGSVTSCERPETGGSMASTAAGSRAATSSLRWSCGGGYCVASDSGGTYVIYSIAMTRYQAANLSVWDYEGGKFLLCRALGRFSTPCSLIGLLGRTSWTRYVWFMKNASWWNGCGLVKRGNWGWMSFPAGAWMSYGQQYRGVRCS